MVIAPLSGLKLAAAAVALAVLTVVLIGTSARSAAAEEYPEFADLYALLKDEIQDKLSGNSYAGLGNRWQIDGKAYNYLYRGLTAYERLLATGKAPDFAGKADSLHRQQASTRELFDSVLQNLSWPQYRLEVFADRIEMQGPEPLRLWEALPARVLFTVRNRTGESRAVNVSAAGLLPSRRITMAPKSVRHLMGVVERPGTALASVLLQATAGRVHLERSIPVRVRPTGILEVQLVNEIGSPGSARVRVTSAESGYLPPEAHTYGLIIKMFGPEHDQVAERWFYADGTFRVRAPAGPVEVRIRKGLEYRSLNLSFDVPAGGTLHKRVDLTRWIDMSKKGWRSADVHVHYFDPPSIRYEMEAEDIGVANVLVMNEYGAIMAREHFTGGLDGISNARRLVYYSEEFRHEELGHLALFNLKSLIEPISTGHLGAMHEQIFRGTYFKIGEEPRKPRADAASPDRLLVDAMRETHLQGGTVTWAHLRDELEFALDAALGELDAVDIITDTTLDQAFEFWYSLLNCGLHLPATAGSDRSVAHIPIGHQRTYAKLPFPFSYADWIAAIRKGASFVTNGPMIELSVDRNGPGDEIAIASAKQLRITARAESQLPIETLEIIQNGKVIRAVKADASGTRAEVAFEHTIDGPAWIAARTLGPRHPEIIFYPHPEWSHRIAAHTSPVYIKYRDVPLAVPDAARRMLARVRKLEDWASGKAFFGDDAARDEALRNIERGARFYRRIAEKP